MQDKTTEQIEYEHYMQIQTLRAIIADMLLTTATLPPMVQQRAVDVLVMSEPKTPILSKNHTD